MKRILSSLFLGLPLLFGAPSALDPVTPRLMQNAAVETHLSGLAQAQAWLAEHLPAAPGGRRAWVLVREQESLLDQHYTFACTIDGIPLFEGDVVLSIAKKDGRIQRVVHQERTRHLPRLAAKYRLSADDAMAVAWQHLKVRGDLETEPGAAPRYVQVDGRLRLAWLVDLVVTEPIGDWLLVIDAVDGRVLDVRNHRRFHTRGEPRPSADLPLQTRAEALVRFRAKQQRRSLKATTPSKRVDGRATLFDPDPVTTLGRFDLVDDSHPDAFLEAYVTRPLRDITFRDGRYHLSGPWVTIADFDPPETEPTTTEDGFWQFRRGQQGFNDAMSYYHIDENQRYLQRLGFQGDTGIQNAPIGVDADAYGGRDDSGYSSALNLLYFGHGCVDDNEDADVIIHEYGHAIQHAVEPNFTGGDTFMLGEGFGDYWAGSWSVRTLQGLQVNPEWVFAWDGHNECWDGRRLNDFEQQYEPGRSYDRHVHGQIWSTGAFQALLALMRRGIPREEVDQIIIESMFGLGRGVTAPVWCERIVETARRLRPNGPHARVLENAFARQNLLEATATYTYLSAHIPPATASWQSEVSLVNPNETAAELNLVTFSDENGAFANLNQETRVLESGETLTLNPAGEGQRWLRIESDLPLAGQSLLTRAVSDVTGRESALLPLAEAGESGNTFVLPHVPADRARFWSGLVVVNPTGEEVGLTIELVGERGTDLSGLLSSQAPASLAAYQKWVGFLAEGPAGETGLFEDGASEERVAWVRVRADQPLNSFQLYGYRADRGEAATSAVAALPDQVRELQPIHIGTEGLDWSGFSILNPNDTDADVTVTLYGGEGRIFAQETIRIAPRAKTLGLNLRGADFIYPSDAPRIRVDGDSVHTAVVGCALPLRIFGLGGDHGNTTIDGAAADGLFTRATFLKPVGTLHLFKAKLGGAVTLTRRFEDGETRVETMEMVAGERRLITFEPGLQAVEISGDYLTATLIHTDENRALTMVPGKQIAVHHP